MGLLRATGPITLTINGKPCAEIPSDMFANGTKLQFRVTSDGAGVVAPVAFQIFGVAGIAAGFEGVKAAADAVSAINAINGALTAVSSPPGVTFPSIIGKAHRANLAAKAKRTASDKLTRIAERSRDTMKREAARVELLARMAPPMPDIRDERDNLPDAEPVGIVRRPL